MARTEFPVYAPTPDGVTIPGNTSFDIANGMRFPAGDDIVLLIVNPDTIARTLTLVLPPPPDLADAVDRTVNLPANSSTTLVGPFPRGSYEQAQAGDPVDAGQAWVNCNAGGATPNGYALRVPRS